MIFKKVLTNRIPQIKTSGKRAKTPVDDDMGKDGKLRATSLGLKATQAVLQNGDQSKMAKMALDSIDADTIGLDSYLGKASMDSLDRVQELAGSTSKESAKILTLAQAMYPEQFDYLDAVQEQHEQCTKVYLSLARTLVLNTAASATGRVSWEAISTKARQIKEEKLLRAGAILNQIFAFTTHQNNHSE